MAASANRRKQDDKNLEILRELISINGNKYCLDCNQRGPTYVNTTIGSFVCSKCSGMLRGLTPPHRVKSISMATFTPEELDFIKNRGNDYCKRVWLGLYEGESVNYNDEQSVKDFMSDKYEKKRYYLEPSSNLALPNGNSLSKNKLKSKNSESSNTALISIASQAPVTSFNNNMHAGKTLSNAPAVKSNEPVHKIARPVNNFLGPLMNNINTASNSAPAPPVPDFPVDFSTANIYNSAQFLSNENNNFVPQTVTVNNTLFNGFNTATSSNTTNDRYAALADLDMALRQEKIKNLDENNTCNNTNNKNPFQSTSNSDLFSNKNPFFNGAWSTNNMVSPLPINPFMPSSNNGGFGNSNNPFL